MFDLTLRTVAEDEGGPTVALPLKDAEHSEPLLDGGFWTSEGANPPLRPIVPTGATVACVQVEPTDLRQEKSEGFGLPVAPPGVLSDAVFWSGWPSDAFERSQLFDNSAELGMGDVIVDANLASPLFFFTPDPPSPIDFDALFA